VSVGVVVVLEAVEVEERERGGRLRGGALERRFQIELQPAPVAEAGERVRDRFVAGVVEHRRVVAERDREAEDDHPERAGRTAEGRQQRFRTQRGEEQDREGQSREHHRDRAADP
jgi:hypothetical protein